MRFGQASYEDRQAYWRRFLHEIRRRKLGEWLVEMSVPHRQNVVSDRRHESQVHVERWDRCRAYQDDLPRPKRFYPYPLAEFVELCQTEHWQ